MNNIDKKKGITLTSLVIYVILFFGLTIFVTNISSNMNQQLFEQRGLSINISNLNKMQYNFFVSSSYSDSIFINDNEISFSNGDTYKYNENKRTIYKNGGILCTNIDVFSFERVEDANGIKIMINVTFTRYLNTIQREIVLFVEEIV